MYSKIAFKELVMSLFLPMFVLIIVLLLCPCLGISQKIQSTEDCGNIETSELQGKINGTWKGVYPGTGLVSGGFEIEISTKGTVTGNYSGIISGTISGCVDRSGYFQAEGVGSGPAVTWTGQVKKSKDTILALGKWSAASGSGTWSGRN